ncbi:MAG TPA: hypothetical protein VG389_21425 [Myxococcota bacterium]|nr:hypothetical protein [Myxococcota bacterium]
MMGGEESWVRERFELLERLQRTIERCKADPVLAETSVMQEAELRAQQVYNLLHAEADRRTWDKGEPTMHFWPPPLDTFDAAERAVVALAKRARADDPNVRRDERAQARTPPPAVGVGFRREGSISDVVAVPRDAVLRAARRRTSPPPESRHAEGVASDFGERFTSSERTPRPAARTREPSWSSSDAADLPPLYRPPNPWRVAALVLAATLLGVLLGGLVFRAQGEEPTPPARSAAPAPKLRAPIPPRALTSTPAAAATPAPAPGPAPLPTPTAATARAAPIATTTSAPTDTTKPAMTTVTSATATKPASVKSPPRAGAEPPLPRKHASPKGTATATPTKGAAPAAAPPLDCRKSKNPLCGIPL